MAGTGTADFSPYIKAVESSGERTRSIIYVNLVLIAVAIALVRNYVYPCWDKLEFANAKRITHCISNIFKEEKPNNKPVANSKAEEEYCDNALMNRFKIHLKSGEGVSIQEIAGSDGKADDPFHKDHPYIKFILKSYVNEIDNRTAHEFYRIPLFDVELHENDAWILTGVFGSISMLLLRAFMRREYMTIKEVACIIPDAKSKFLLLSTQIFATPLEEGRSSVVWFIRSFSFLLLFFLLPFLHILLIWHDIFDDTDRGIVWSLLGPTGASTEHVFRIIAGIVLCWLGVRCWLTNYDIDQKIKFISETTYPLDAQTIQKCRDSK